jgi:thymidine kinase
MGSSKTANALMTKFNYEEKGYKVLLLKPSIDMRDGETIIKSRIGLQSEAIVVGNKNLYEMIKYVHKNINCIIVDECQFLTVLQINQLKQITIELNTPVFCYGLRTDFKSKLFEGSKRLFEIADSISEIKSICHCGNKAIINARIKDGKIIYDGEQIDIGGNDKYIGLCYKCWIEGNLS